MSKESDARKKLLNGEKSAYEKKKKSTNKYLAKFKNQTLRMPVEEAPLWKQAAENHGKSLNQYICDLVYADNPDLFPAESEKTE